MSFWLTNSPRRGLITPFLHGRARLLIEPNPFIVLGRNCKQHFGGFVLIGFRQLPNLLDSVVEQFGHWRYIASVGFLS
jgi:hypothetical protein